MTFTIDLIYNTHMKTIQAINSYRIKAFLKINTNVYRLTFTIDLIYNIHMKITSTLWV